MDSPLQGTPVFITGSLFSLKGFPCKPLYFPVRDCSEVKFIMFCTQMNFEIIHIISLGKGIYNAAQIFWRIFDDFPQRNLHQICYKLANIDTFAREV